MGLSPLFSTIAASSLLFCLVFVVSRWSIHRKLPLPPGPPGNWLFGNSLPTSFTYRYFETLTQEYGPIFTIRQGLTSMVVIGRFDAAVTIMEKGGALTADRPRNIASGEVLSGGLRTLFTPFGEKFRRMRRAFNAHLGPQVLRSSASTYMRNGKELIFDIINCPDEFQQHTVKFSATILMNMAYAMRVESYQDQSVQSIRRCMMRLAQSFRPGYWKVDVYPFLRFIPGYLSELRKGHQEELGLFLGLLEKVKERMASNHDTPPSFAKYLLERQQELGLADGEVAYMAGALFGAGSDTTSATLNAGIMAGALYPESQQKLWEELERVVGRERPPTLADQDSLPWVTAWVLEVMRWRPVTAGGFPHKATDDIIWNGYLIPKGTCIHGNIWSINRDPVYYPEPEKFDPSRWITADGKIRDDLRAFSFGFGRRVCPGQHFASGSLFLSFALLFWSFQIKENAKCPIDEWSFTDGGNAHPKPFKVIFEPRMSSSLEEVKALYEDYEL